MGGACGTYGAEGRHTHTVLMREPVGEMPHGRPRRRWEDNIKTDLQEAGWWGAWTGLIWLRIGTRWRVLEGTLMNVGTT